MSPISKARVREKAFLLLTIEDQELVAPAAGEARSDVLLRIVMQYSGRPENLEPSASTSYQHAVVRFLQRLVQLKEATQVKRSKKKTKRLKLRKLGSTRSDKDRFGIPYPDGYPRSPWV